jgi:hypothetical protein
VSKLMQGTVNNGLQRSLNLLGLNISESELDKLMSGNILSLEDRSLSEIGSVFILAEALSAINSVKSVTFQELLECCPGISICCWNSDLFDNYCLLLTFVDGKPALKVSFPC